MKKFSTLKLSALAAFLAFGGAQASAQQQMVIANSSITSIALAGGVVTVTGRAGPDAVVAANQSVVVDSNLAGLAYADGNIPGAVAVSDVLFTLTGATLPVGGPNPANSFTSYGTLKGPPNWVGYDASVANGLSPLTPSSYSGLTFVVTVNLGGFGSNNFYMIHHGFDGGGSPLDYFADIVPAAASVVNDLKPMSNTGLTGFFALTYSLNNPNGQYDANDMYYLRTAAGHTQFGKLVPALGSYAVDKIDLTTAVGSFGVGDYSALFVMADNVDGNGADQFYYLRQDNTGTGNTILGRLNPSLAGGGVRTISDIANLGGKFNTLVYTPTAIGVPTWGANHFYITGALKSVGGLPAQSISFAAIPNQKTGVSFAVTPSANLGDGTSGGTITLSVVAGTATIDIPFGGTFGVFNVIPTSAGIITLQAKQSGGTSTTNWMQQSFNAFGTSLDIPTQNLAQGVAATSFIPVSTAGGTGTITFSVLPALPGTLAINPATGEITGNPGVAAGSTPYTITVTDSIAGTSSKTFSLIVGIPPVISSPSTAAGTVGAAFNYAIANTGGTATSWSVTGGALPAGLSIDTGTGIISGTPTVAGTYIRTIHAINAFGNGPGPLTITIAAGGSAPIITNNTLTAAGTVGQPFSFTTTATTGSSSNSYAANGLPAGLSIASATGIISGTPTTVGTSVVTLFATNSNGLGTATLKITVAAVGSTPVITNSPLIAVGTVGQAFGFTITATGTPTSYAATSLPAGLSIVAATGAITGTPTAAGISVVTLSATNGTGTGTATLTITVASATVAPIITSPATAPGTVGTSFATYLIIATGLPTGYTATGLPAGLTVNALTGAINGTPTTAGTYAVTLTATNAFGTGTAPLTITVAPTAVTPIITSPATAQGIAGTPFVTYLIGATGLPTSFTATGLPLGLTLDPLTGAINGTPTTAGTYVVTITATNTSGTSTATLTITVAPLVSSRIVNFSARALSGPGDQTLIMGFVVAGDNTHLLVRGIGPTLASFGIVNFLADPLLTLYNGPSAIATNDDWQIDSSGLAQGALIQAAGAQVGAFALPNGSKDSALLFTVNNGAHTTGLLRANSTAGVALTEIYDLDTVAGSRLINVAARMNVTTGEGTLIAGLVIAGTTPKTVLIRGVGPTLSVFGVGGVLADPQISVVSGNTQIASNDNWETGTSTAAQIIAASAQVGAFALPSGSKDAALLITLQPGAYTVVLTGVGNTTGVALVEVYDTL